MSSCHPAGCRSCWVESRALARFSIITATPQSVRAGSGTFVAADNFARGLRSLGHEVAVVAPSWRRLGPAYTLRRFIFNWSLTKERFTSDVLIGVDLDGFLLAGGVPRPFVAVIMGMLKDEAAFERGTTRLTMRIQAMAEGAGARRARLVVTTSEYSRERVTAAYGVPGHRVFVVRPGIDLDRWRAAVGERRSARGDPTVLTVCHLYRRKNVEALINAAVRMRDHSPPVRFRIVGDGPDGRRLRRLAGAMGVDDRVSFLGHLPFELLAGEFASADLFCLPSLQEGFGLVFVEAMAAGLPVVACRAGATSEVVRHDVNGLLVPPGDHSALVEAIERLVGDHVLRRRMAATNRTVAGEFSLERSAARFVKVLEREIGI